jgi:hypothetical protein
VVGKILFKVLIKPRRHTVYYVVASTLLVIMLTKDFQSETGSPIYNISLLISLSFLALNEATVNIERMKRDLAVLLAVGVKRRIIGLIAAGRAFLWNLLICLIGAGSGLTLQLLGFLPFLTSSFISTYLPMLMIGPSIPAATCAVCSILNLNVPEALRV